MDPNKGTDPHTATAWSLQRDVLTNFRTLQDVDAECQYGFEGSSNVRRKSHYQVVQGILMRDTSPEPRREPVKHAINTLRWLRAREAWESARSDTSKGKRKNLMSELSDAALALRSQEGEVAVSMTARAVASEDTLSQVLKSGFRIVVPRNLRQAIVEELLKRMTWRRSRGSQDQQANLNSSGIGEVPLSSDVEVQDRERPSESEREGFHVHSSNSDLVAEQFLPLSTFPQGEGEVVNVRYDSGAQASIMKESDFVRLRDSGATWKDVGAVS